MYLLLKDILNMAEARFSMEGCLTPRLDAEILFCHMLGRDRTWLILHYGDDLDDRTCEEYFKLVDIRAGGMPLQYITGSQEFMGLTFHVNESVLIPRQDTETLVEKALIILNEEKTAAKNLRVLDLCCGSGAIAVSLAYYLKKSGRKAAITATDISHEALKIAEENAMINGVAKQVCFAEGDLFEPFRKGRKGRGRVQFNLIVCNPPYIPTGTLDSLMREVREHEPLNALDGGADGMDFYRRILKEAHLHLAKDGVLLLEIGYDQGKWIPLLAEEERVYGDTEILKDLSGRDRVALVRMAADRD
ncbi:MAG TPA: peptide chain release factor N(5)-glutamine methyltransferase [Bacillota bacterium]|jgi:release factor glutamine methyltransferase|nr:peptide chain release factor N(5)-glutamine methyltransferase [Bacillota bacterium]